MKAKRAPQKDGKRSPSEKGTETRTISLGLLWPLYDLRWPLRVQEEIVWHRIGSIGT